MPAPDPPPNPDQHRGSTLRAFLEALVSWLRRNQPLFDPADFDVSPSPGGRKVRAAGQGAGISIAITTSTITARSGNTPGTGTVRIRKYVDPALETLDEDIDVLNWAGSSFAGGKHCEIKWINGHLWIGPVEC